MGARVCEQGHGLMALVWLDSNAMGIPPMPELIELVLDDRDKDPIKQWPVEGTPCPHKWTGHDGSVRSNDPHCIRPGIQTFICDHKCGDVCRSLDLEKSVPLTLDDAVPLPAEGSDGEEDSIIQDLIDIGSQSEPTQSTENPTKNTE
ncbi:hypothetical protein C8F04DRAFT_1178318 [Mycena alexandri]|uniref:Uncharacterized protein n=1 Tax=Mycena alexandri TaxID=1745969 RepID=A0AAD6T549_9AGAR|nr:hypothetical protein C8F04DRAFT_1178318 [Mycena alexandri]